VIPFSGAYCIKRQRMRKIMKDMIDREKERVRKIYIYIYRERERERQRERERERERDLVIKITDNAVMHNL